MLQPEFTPADALTIAQREADGMGGDALAGQPSGGLGISEAGDQALLHCRRGGVGRGIQPGKCCGGTASGASSASLVLSPRHGGAGEGTPVVGARRRIEIRVIIRPDRAQPCLGASAKPSSPSSSHLRSTAFAMRFHTAI